MARKRELVIDAYNVIKVFRQLGVSFEDICSLGCSIDGEPELKLTPRSLPYGTRKKRRSGRQAHRKGPSPGRKTSNYRARPEAFSARSDRKSRRRLLSRA